MPDHEDVSISRIKHVADQVTGILRRQDFRGDLQLFGQGIRSLLRAFGLRHVDLLDAGVLQHVSKTICAFDPTRTQGSVGIIGGLFRMANQVNRPYALLCT